MKLHELQAYRDTLQLAGISLDSEAVSHSLKTDAISEKIVRYVDAEKEFYDMLEHLIDLKTETLHRINEIASAKERLYLTARYVELKSCGMIASENGVTKRDVFKVLKNGLENLQRIFDRTKKI